MQFGHVTDWIPGFSQMIVMFGANLLVHSTLLICTGLLAVYLFRRYGPAVQSVILRATLIAVLACPIVAFVIHDTGKSLTVSIPATNPVAVSESASKDITNITEKTVSTSMEPALVMTPPAGEDVQVEESYESMRPLIEKFWVKVVLSQSIDLKTVLYVVLSGTWFVMSFFALCRLFIDSLYIYWLRRNAYDADIEVLKRAKKLAREFEIEPPVILLSPDVGSPFVSGFSRPILFVPMGIDVTREVLIHEYGHIVRNDYLWNLCGHFVASLMPFPVLVRLLISRLEDISDYICDDYVVSYSHNSRLYLKQLLSIAERFCPTRMERVFGVGIIRIHSAIGKRIQRLVNRTGTVLVTIRFRGIFLIAMFTSVATLLTGLVSIDAYQELTKDSTSFELSTMSAPTNGFYQEWQRSANFTRPVMTGDNPDKKVIRKKSISEKKATVSEKVALVSSQKLEKDAGQVPVGKIDTPVVDVQPVEKTSADHDGGSIAGTGNETVESSVPFIEALEENKVLNDEFMGYVNSLKTVGECV